MTFKKLVVSTCSAVIVSVVVLPGTSLLAATNRNGFDYADALIPPDEIFWGGVRRDGIPAIQNPRFLAASDVKFLRGKDRILGVVRNGIAKAYPIRIIERHEVVNDRFGDEAVVVTYCPLCFSGMAFTPKFGDTDLRFGVSGLLYNSDVLLYDYRTGSLWSQLLSKAISGPLKGAEIPPIPTANTTWRDWQKRHPDTLVLSTDTGFRMGYRGSPYGEYQSKGQLMFPVALRNRAYRNKELVLGIKTDGVEKAYPFKELRKHGEVSFRDSIGGTELTIEWLEKEKYARAVDSDDNEIPTVIVYWFAWYAFHPETEIFTH